MKKITLIFVLILFSHLAFSQSCLPEGIEFTSQAQIDSFQVDYPGCTEIEGRIYISGSDITSLQGLNTITSIGGYLAFSACDSLENLHGMEGLTYVGGDFGVIDCDAIASLQVFQALTSIGGDLRIISNANLLSLVGLQNIDASSIIDIWIDGNTSLSSCEAENICEYLSSPNGSVSIYNNAPGCSSPPQIAEACGISLPCLPFGNYYFKNQSGIDNFKSDYPDCTDLAGYLRINGNDITNLDSLDNLHSVEYSVEIYSCDSLESLAGLENLSSIGYQLEIVHNGTLSSLTGLENLVSLNSTYIQDNGSLVSVEGLSGLTAINAWVYIVSCTALESLSGLENLTSIGGSLGIGNDSSLASLAGLENLMTVGGELKISGNNALFNLSGLDNLSAIGGHLTIEDNTYLESLTGIDNVEGHSIDNLKISYNTALSQCAVESICEYLASPNGNVDISNNAEGCYNEDEVMEECAAGTGQLDGWAVEQLDISVYPNPAEGIVDFRFSISDFRYGRVMLEIYDVNGREKAVVFDGDKPAGEYTAQYDTSVMEPGMYFYRLTADGNITSGKLVIY
jgi:hypothetical protein